MGTFPEVVLWYVSVGEWICGLQHFLEEEGVFTDENWDGVSGWQID